MKSEGRNKRGQFKKGNPQSRTAALKSGAYAFKLTGKVPSVRGARTLLRELERVRADLEAATPQMNIKKGLLINQIVNSHGFMRLFEMYAKQSGLLHPKLYKGKVLDFHPGFRTYLSFATLQQKAISLLGLDPEQAEDVVKLPYEYTEEKK